MKYHKTVNKIDRQKVHDKEFMAKALALAAQGAPRNNPFVGAVIVEGEKILGEGFHRGDGSPHAEIEALRSAKGNSAKFNPKKITLYSTLEPCSGSWKGKTNGPCTDAIIASGIRRVVIANIDSNPRVNGRGVNILREQGIDVLVGVLAQEENLLNRKYRKRHLSNKPYVHLKMAQTLDGRIAREAGKETGITGIEVQSEVHKLRGRYQAVLTGMGTVLADNPEFTVRNVKGINPLRVVLDSQLRTPLSSSLLDIDIAPTIIYHSDSAPESKKKRLNQMGIQTQVISNDAYGRLSLKELSDDLYQKEIYSLLIEGGSRIATSFLTERLVDEVSWFIRPGFGGAGVSVLGYYENDNNSLWDYSLLQKTQISKIGEDFLINGLTAEGVECLRD